MNLLLNSNPSLPVLVLLTAFACSESTYSAEPSSESQSASRFLEGITYGVVDSIELKLNIAIPAEPADGDQRYPLIIFIHGGRWQTGHRNAYNCRIRKAAKRGYVATTISHRLTAEQNDDGQPMYPWPAAIHDCKVAVRFLKTHAAQFKIDPHRIGVTGASSGGHLALMLGLADETAGLEGDVCLTVLENSRMKPVENTRVHAVFNKSGPTEMVSSHAAPVVTRFVEDLLGRPVDNRKKYRDASPIAHISDDDPPIMTIHGELDPVVPVEQARMLDRAMNAAGLSHEYLELNGEKHVFSPNGGTIYWNALYRFFGKRFDSVPRSQRTE